MAGEKDAVIEIEEDGVVEIELDPTAQGDAAGTQKTTKPSAADEAAAALNQAVETEKTARKAAEDTAASERRAREEAQRVAAQKDVELAKARETTENQELTILTNGIASATRDVETCQRELEAANEAGDFKASAAVQVRLSKAAATLDRLETDKTAYEGRIKNPVTTEGRVEAPAGQTQADRVERYLGGFSPTAQTWLRAHPECLPAQLGGDAKKNSQMMAGHYDALAKNLTEGTPAYYQNIEEHAGYRTPTSAAAEVTLAGERPAPKPAPKPAAPRPSAPVSRDGQDGGGQLTTKSVRLTPQQQEVALFSYPSNPGESEAAWKKRAFGTYAVEFVKATNEGKIGRLTH